MSEQKKAIAQNVHLICSRIPGATFYSAAEMAIEAMDAARRTVSGQEAQPSEFEAHGELDAEGWTPAVFPDKQYFMKCCDCGLVHEMDFAAVRTEETAGGFYSDELPWPDNRVRFRVRRADAAPIPATEPKEPK